LSGRVNRPSHQERTGSAADHHHEPAARLRPARRADDLFLRSRRQLLVHRSALGGQLYEGEPDVAGGPSNAAGKPNPRPQDELRRARSRCLP
jgi:hypothetical protein